MSDAAPRTVLLSSVPVALYTRAAAHDDALRRELTLMRGSGSDADGLPEDLESRLEDAAARFTMATQPVQQTLLASHERGEGSCDVTCVVGPEVADDARVLRALLDEVDEYCRRGPLLTLASPPELRAFRHWYLDQFIAQVDGAAPSPWEHRTEAEPESSCVVVHRHAEDGTAVLSLHGDIDLVSAGDVRQALHDLRAQGHRDVVLDASDVTFLDSVGMSVLMVTARRLADDGGQLVVRNPSPTVRDALRISGVDTLLEVDDRTN